MSHAVFFNEYASYGWLAFQNRLWTADRLIIQGWLNQIVCPYAKTHDETAIHTWHIADSMLVLRQHLLLTIETTAKQNLLGPFLHS